MNYRPAYILWSSNNTWNHNYWTKPKQMPQIIWGREGSEVLTPHIDFDFHPAKVQNDI